MLKDRKVLVEKEIESLRAECAQGYLAMIRGVPLDVSYEPQREKLASLMVDLSLIDMMIKNGQE